jgi:hypothetical protein
VDNPFEPAAINAGNFCHRSNGELAKFPDNEGNFLVAMQILFAPPFGV